jgi:hypothetical protein
MSTSAIPDVQAFYERCARADWHVWAIDDGTQHRIAKAKHDALVRDADSHPALRAVYDAWHAYTHSGEAFGTLHKDRPAMPHALPPSEGQLSIYDCLGD